MLLIWSMTYWWCAPVCDLQQVSNWRPELMEMEDQAKQVNKKKYYFTLYSIRIFVVNQIRPVCNYCIIYVYMCIWKIFSIVELLEDGCWKYCRMWYFVYFLLRSCALMGLQSNLMHLSQLVNSDICKWNYPEVCGQIFVKFR